MRSVMEYCKKGGNWIDWGVDPQLARRLTHVEKMNYILTHDIDDILTCGHFGVGETANALKLKQFMQARKLQWPIFRKRRVYWFYGSTGSGKTRVGMRIVRRHDKWVKLNGSLRSFVNGYEDQAGVMIDDLRAGTIDFETLLAILDGYPTWVNVKGGIREWIAETIVITAPKRPEEVFYDHTREQPWDKVDQLLRRIDVLRDFDEMKYGEDPDDLTTVVIPVCGPLVRSLPTEVVEKGDETPAAEEAELEEEPTISVIQGSLDGPVDIVDGGVVPRTDN